MKLERRALLLILPCLSEAQAVAATSTEVAMRRAANVRGAKDAGINLAEPLRNVSIPIVGGIWLPPDRNSGRSLASSRWLTCQVAALSPQPRGRRQLPMLTPAAQQVADAGWCR